MISAASFIDAGRARGFSLYTGVPCSYLKPFINYVIESDTLDYVAAANEGDAIAIAAGAELGGRRAVVMFQNSGLGNAVNPLSSLAFIFRLPMLLIVTARGQPGGAADEPQHALMGGITTRQLDLLEVPWAPFPDDEADIAGALDRVDAHIAATGRPYALVMAKGAVAPHPLTAQAPSRPIGAAPPDGAMARAVGTRSEVLQRVQQAATDRDLVLATTGYTGRELYALDDRANQLYMVGSMGCVSSLGLGLALARPDRRVIALDGDGALLMRLGALSTIGFVRPDNLIHILLDNAMHESTGGQATVSDSVDFCAIAAACGYPAVARCESLDAVSAHLADAAPGLRFLHVKTDPGVPDGLPRPKITPAAVARRFREHLAAAAP